MRRKHGLARAGEVEKHEPCTVGDEDDAVRSKPLVAASAAAVADDEKGHGAEGGLGHQGVRLMEGEHVVR